MPDQSNDLKLSLLDLRYKYLVNAMRDFAITFSASSAALGGGSAVLAYGAATVHGDELARKAEHEAAWQSWQANPPQTVSAAKVSFGKNEVLAPVIDKCAEELVSSQTPQPYTLQADNSLAVSAPVFASQQVQQTFTTCVAEKVVPVAMEQPGYGTTIFMGGMSLAMATAAVFIGVQAKKSWSLYKEGKAEYERERAALTQQP